MSLFQRLRHMLQGDPSPAPSGRLSEAEAVALARAAAGDHWLRDKLNVATLQRDGQSRLVWSVETGGVGSHLRIVIDDASGSVLERSAHEGR